MICVIATIEVVEGRCDDFLAEFRRVVSEVRKEPGCLAYVPMVDVATGVGLDTPARPDVVTVVEQWESLEALESHFVAPHMIQYRKRIKGLVKGSSLRLLAPA